VGALHTWLLTKTYLRISIFSQKKKKKIAENNFIIIERIQGLRLLKFGYFSQIKQLQTRKKRENNEKL